MAIDFSNIAGNIRDKEGNTRESYLASQNQSSSSNVPDQIQVGANPNTDQPIFVQSQASKEKDLAEKKAAILALAGNANSYSPSPGSGGIDRDKVISFRQESGMSGPEYSSFLQDLKKANPSAFDKQFPGPSDAIQNFIKGGGILGNILSSIFDNVKEAGVNAIENMAGMFEGEQDNTGVMANTGSATGDTFRKNYALGDPMGLFQQNLIPGYENTNQPQNSIDFQKIFGGQMTPEQIAMIPSTMQFPVQNPQFVNAMNATNNPALTQNMGKQDGGGLAPMMPNMAMQNPVLQDALSTPLGTLSYKGGGMTPKNAAIQLGIVDDFDEGIMRI
tara:strand:- start:9912 stop:10907 length:996 start_codon:yes stop_codon:yes gene_type:complete